MKALQRAAALAWGAPYSAIALLAGAILCMLGGAMRVHAGCIEFSLRAEPAQCGRALRRFPFRAITLGHVIIGITASELADLRAHEHVHVRQYEQWGPFFGPAYLCASAWQWLRGRDAYWDNCFEVQARAATARCPTRP